ncbi:transglycosylase domain-containing protein [Bacillus sp. 1P06AnD]|uniref:transglycosylase domain-containing protein n=1 Tax=Bacillus sp. 1P06AnD TaxID=3132208 RepID=UPI0039A0ADDF
MRTFFGYLLIIATFTIFLFFVRSFHDEWNQLKPVTAIIEDKISLKENAQSTLSYIKSADGKTISHVSAGQKRIYLPSARIPQIIKDAFVISEDRSFFQHGGVDASAIARAFIENAKHERIEQGGSTITQQLARNLYLNQEKTYNRKFSELLYAYQLEKKFSKDQLLEQYINAIYFGNGIYGIEAASRYYFNRPSNHLTQGELILLAAIPNNPTLYDPFKRMANVKKRQERLIDQLVQAGKLSEQQGRQIKVQHITLKHGAFTDLYPDYVTYVEHEFKQLVAEQDGLIPSLESQDPSVSQEAQKKLERKVNQLLASGITIYTSLDRKIQQLAQTSLQTYLPEKDVEGATAVILHTTHELVSLTGAKEYKKYSFHRGFQSYRQPGSAIKPLLDYGPYLDVTGASINKKVNAGPFCSKSYCPQNYNNGIYGYVSIKSAFAHSYNTPALRLFQETGIDRSFSYLDRFGFKQIKNTDHILPAAIGGFTYGMSPLELTDAYTSFVDGQYQQAVAIKYVKDASGRIIYKWKKSPKQIWSDQTVQKLRVLLHSVVAEGTAKSASYPTKGYIGAKTGTTNDFKDLWIVGLNDSYTAGVWVGKDKPANIQYTGSPQLAVWKNIMKHTK